MMLNLVPILMLLSTIFLSSCEDDFPTIEPQNRCVIVILESDDISAKGYCRCHLYQWGMDGIGRITESTNYPLNYCNKLVGFHPQSNAKIYEWQESIRLWLKRHQEKK